MAKHKKSSSGPPDLSLLNGMTIRQLKQRWKEVGVRGEPPNTKALLVRELAWRLQRDRHGDLDAETRRRLKAAIRNARSTGRDSSRCEPRRQRADKPRLLAGTTLVRTWRGRDHEVRVVEPDKRFIYDDVEYASLSEIARHITGARWSGPRFFGLHKLAGAA
ncbi:MAG: DUF2924 domain-containing protein [Planctomycetota bacterium]